MPLALALGDLKSGTRDRQAMNMTMPTGLFELELV
jgi:hypothetical protein